ncbi:hypothetical protein EVAR_96702_1 [Eumeta japonica]|uniref:RNA-directed DNA polymerase from mobile element jockey n=1 Tax=Eumeta variegata TaxID=151549 RepID=A0A4C1WGA4_EUMVA|nr:hypothetical protein EVAR_96702_1 [Eumeta japonica]
MHGRKEAIALYYRCSLYCGPINIPSLINMEATDCRLPITGHSTLVILSVYLPSSKGFVRRDLRALLALGDAVILFGDFNYKIDFAKGTLTNVRTVVEESEREVPTSSGRRQFSPDILELIIAKNSALRLTSAYPTPDYIARARAFQREVKARVQEFRNEKRYIPIPPLKKPDNSVALDDVEIAECLADSLETQCSHTSPPHDIAHINLIEEEAIQKTSIEPKDDLPPVSLSEVQTLVKSLNTKKKAIDELGQWFRNWSIQVNPEKSAAIQFKYSKIRSQHIVDFDNPNLKLLNANIPWQRNYKYLEVALDKNLHFRDHIERVRKTAIFYTARLGAMRGRKTGFHSNALLRAAVDYEPPHPNNFIRRPRNVLNDPPDALTATDSDALLLVKETTLTASRGSSRRFWTACAYAIMLRSGVRTRFVVDVGCVGTVELRRMCYQQLQTPTATLRPAFVLHYTQVVNILDL